MPTTLTKGQNAPLDAARVLVALQLTAPADLSALLVGANGKVRSDADFVFYNQPTGPGVRLVPGAAGQAPAVEIDLAQVPADIEQVRVVITLDDTSSSFGRFAPPTATVGDSSGTPLFEYVIDGLADESVVIALEVYRRQGAWKVRAVGQGYSGGFAALVTDHGVQLEDEPPQAAPAPAAAAPAAPPASAAPAAPAAPSYGAPAVPPVPSGPPAPSYGAPTPPPAAPPTPGAAPQAPSYQPPAAAEAPSYGAQAAPPAPSYGAPAGPPQQQAPQQPAPHQPAGDAELTTNRPLSLAKGQRVSLRKDGGQALQYVRMGLGWDPVVKRGLFGNREIDIDLDASVVMFAGPSIVDVAYYGQLASKDGSIRHSGDNLTGEGAGDDEVVHVDLTRIPPHVDTILFIVTSYKGQTFEQVANAFCRLVDGASNAELARYTLQGGMPFTAMAMSKVYRQGGDWKLQAIGEGFNARHVGEAAPQLGRFVG